MVTADWTVGDITPIDTSSVDWASFTPADSGFDSGIFDGGEIVVTAPSGQGPVEVTPWNDFTAVATQDLSSLIEAPNLDAIAQTFANWTPAGSAGCFSSPGTFIKCAVSAAGNIAKGVSAGGGGGAAGGGAAQQKPQQQPQKTALASLWPFALFIGAFVLIDAFSD